MTEETTVVDNGAENTDGENGADVFRNDCESLRCMCSGIEGEMLKLINNGSEKGEIISNLWLAVRHIEDARMRLGKALRAADGWVSCYDG